MGAADTGHVGSGGGGGLGDLAKFRPAGQADLAPAGAKAKAEANLAALRILVDLDAEGHQASAEEQAVLARWSGWGALPRVFDEADDEWLAVRTELRGLLDERAWDAARRTTINAHYTSAEVVAAMWRAVVGLGFSGGRVLEPGCGSGNFIGLAPDGLGLEVVGVELDPTTARIAAALYPDADIRAEGFERTRFPSGWFDLAVGNVPFAKVALTDHHHNPAGHSMHNHFILKSLALTHAGGLVAVITSRYTMDARNPAARREMAELADLVGAVRLPAGAFRAAAGTDAVTDVLFLRRKEHRGPVAGETWGTVANVAVADGEATVNEWYARHPELVLGELRATGGQYGQADLTVRPSGAPLGELLDEALAGLVASASARGLRWEPGPPCQPSAEHPGPVSVALAPELREGSIVAATNGGFARVVDGLPAPFEVKPNKDVAELRSLLGLRDAMATLLDAQVANRDDEAFATAQASLNARYDSYLARYGPLNRFSLVRTGRVDPRTAQPTFRRLRPRMGGFDVDPAFFSVLALEVFDPETQTAVKAPVFSSRVVGPREARRGADTAEDALAICLDDHATPDLEVIAGLLGVTATVARAELADLVWDDPATGDLVAASTYLSGNVRQKLAVAEAAAHDDTRWQPNVEALRAVMPPELGPDEIDARLGSAWIHTGDVEAFMREVLGCPAPVVDHAPLTATWAVSVASWERRSVALTSEWGTSRADAVSLVQSSLNQQAASVYDARDDGSRVLNPAETFAAREKQEALESRFATWAWEDPTRATRLSSRYNELFNSTVLPTYDGGHLSLPGLAQSFRPHPHQRDAVWRIMSEPTTLLAHVVGAGKTATMVMAGMEMRRLGLVKKPVYVVPNHMLAQFSTEMLRLYPLANVLVANRADTTPGARKGFVARCAVGDWDAVVITQSAFERIPVSAETSASFITDRLAELRQAVDSSKGLTVKRLEARMARLEERHKKLLAEHRKDDGVNFEATGIDFLFVDEAQAYKNRQFATHIPGVGGEGSQRAEDLELKLAWLRSRHGQRVATFATATPIANSLAEMYVMQSYLQPESLAAAGIEQFDAWAATFARTVTALELAPDGGSYRLHTRFARFRNVPELLTMFRQIADVRSADQLDLPVPAIVGGHPETLVVASSEELGEYVAELVGRAERVRNRVVRPDEDNMLKISGDGRKAALDLRLVGRPPDPAGGKIGAAAERVARIYRTNKDNAYLDVAGVPSPRRGALQLVFCDLGTPKQNDWSAYEELRGQLAVRGVPEVLVHFVHEARDHKAKAELFAACREGRVAVLVGSTDKMGIGTNVQDRLIALHHLDCPWRPADIEQREGRALRQGNQHDEVAVIRYVTEGSFDIFMWQTVERKASFIHQVMAENVAGREVEDVGDQALSYAEVKALATGNPLIMEKAGVDNDIARLTRLRRTHQQDQTRLTRTLEMASRRSERLSVLAESCSAAIARRVDTRGDRFVMTIDGTRYERRVDAGRQLKVTLAKGFVDGKRVASPARGIGELGGFPVELRVERDSAGVVAHVGLGHTPVRLSLTPEELNNSDGTGLVQRLENRLRGLEEARSEALAEMARACSEAKAAEARIGAPFEHESRLEKLRRRQAEIERALAPEPEAAPTQEPPHAAEPPGVPPSSPALSTGSHDRRTRRPGDSASVESTVVGEVEDRPPITELHDSCSAVMARIVGHSCVSPEQGLEL